MTDALFNCAVCGCYVGGEGCALHPGSSTVPARLVDVSLTPKEALAVLRAPEPPAPGPVGPFKAGDRLQVVKGLRRFDLQARDVVTIDRIEERERREVYLRLSRNGRYVASVYVRHVNRLSDAEFNANTGDPTEVLRLAKWSTRVTMPAARIS